MPPAAAGVKGFGSDRNVRLRPLYDRVPQSPPMLPNVMLVRTRMIRGATVWVATRALLGAGLAMGNWW